jgi:hypothetical protein
MFRKVDKLQNDVDELLDLCNDSDDTEQSEYQELGEMILKAQDGELGKRGFKKMERQLTKDEEALRYYIDFQLLTAMLREHFDKDWLRRITDAFKEYVTA